MKDVEVKLRKYIRERFALWAEDSGISLTSITPFDETPEGQVLLRMAAGYYRCLGEDVLKVIEQDPEPMEYIKERGKDYYIKALKELGRL
ncbi:MAG: hypothetical protein DRP15_00455 [Candidatus Aenigmatarchaeota archaeon]|nr:MAG: hypothetical protein DRP15_00455 [Candidatus Aenigmarchaeota archaeon]